MDNENGRPPEAGDVPEREITINQVVAWNMAYYRRTANITQEQFGEMIGGRPKAAVSADERSWDGKRVREFNAHEIAVMASALDIPIGAFFLPPTDDREKAVYVFRDGDGDRLDMADLTAMVLPDADGDSPLKEVYRARFRASTGRYLDPSWLEELERYFRDAGTPEMRADRAARMRMGRDVLLQVASDMEQYAGAIEKPDGEHE